jgi:hypothetical protein
LEVERNRVGSVEGDRAAGVAFGYDLGRLNAASKEDG